MKHVRLIVFTCQRRVIEIGICTFASLFFYGRRKFISKRLIRIIKINILHVICAYVRIPSGNQILGIAHLVRNFAKRKNTWNFIGCNSSLFNVSYERRQTPSCKVHFWQSSSEMNGFHQVVITCMWLGILTVHPQPLTMSISKLSNYKGYVETLPSRIWLCFVLRGESPTIKQMNTENIISNWFNSFDKRFFINRKLTVPVHITEFDF